MDNTKARNELVTEDKIREIVREEVRKIISEQAVLNLEMQVGEE